MKDNPIVYSTDSIEHDDNMMPPSYDWGVEFDDDEEDELYL